MRRFVAIILILLSTVVGDSPPAWCDESIPTLPLDCMRDGAAEVCAAKLLRMYETPGSEAAHSKSWSKSIFVDLLNRNLAINVVNGAIPTPNRAKTYLSDLSAKWQEALNKQVTASLVPPAVIDILFVRTPTVVGAHANGDLMIDPSQTPLIQDRRALFPPLVLHSGLRRTLSCSPEIVYAGSTVAGVISVVELLSEAEPSSPELVGDEKSALKLCLLFSIGAPIRDVGQQQLDKAAAMSSLFRSCAQAQVANHQNIPINLNSDSTKSAITGCFVRGAKGSGNSAD